MARASAAERTAGFRKMSLKSQYTEAVLTASPSTPVTGINLLSLPSNPVRRHEDYRRQFTEDELRLGEVESFA